MLDCGCHRLSPAGVQIVNLAVESKFSVDYLLVCKTKHYGTDNS
jgi:hypothetical protein